MSVTEATWTRACAADAILNYGGIAAIHEGRQVAIFRVEDQFFCLSNIDPFSNAGVLSRGLVGDRDGVLKVASPLYKQNFALGTGQCLDDEAVKIPAYEVRVSADGFIEIGAEL